ncbi:YdaU family protein [Pseudomonadota bacterium AL_CKDN230030165-1A_HGKHYDSX7]
MNYYPHHIGDYLTATAHLSWLEDAAYRRLLDLYYSREQALPEDIGQACRLVRALTDDERAAVGTVLHEFFTLGSAGWTHNRCDTEIERARAAADRARANGRKGGRPRKASNDASATGPVSPGLWDGLEACAGSEAPNPNPNPNPQQCSVPAGTASASTRMEAPLGAGIGASPRAGLGTVSADMASASRAGQPRPAAEALHADRIFALGLPLLLSANVPERQARAMLGSFRKHHDDAEILRAIQCCADTQAVEPVAYLQRLLRANGSERRTSARQAPSRAQPLGVAWQAELRELVGAAPREIDMGVIDATAPHH